MGYLIESFADFTSGLKLEKLPPEIVTKIKTCVMDAVENIFTDMGDVRTEAAFDSIRKSEALPATVVGTGKKASSEDAAFYNTVKGAVTSRNDSSRTAICHPGSILVPVCLALGEEYGKSGSDMIEALLAGYETMIRLGTCFVKSGINNSWRKTSIVAAFGAAFSAARMAGLSKDKIASSASFACHFAGGVNEWAVAGTGEDVFQNGWGARNGIQAALLAIIIAGVLSIVMTYPLIFSTQRLSRFAKRIAKSDFKPLKGHIVSKELSELGDVMNQMAYKLEESDIEQKTFFQNASHELRTPLMSIQGYAEGLKYGVFESDEDRNNAIDVIIDETGRLSGLVENLLSISKMDMSKSGNYEVKKQTINARKICDTIIDRVRGNFIHEDKAIINDIKIKNAYIYGNENDLIRCLENIFSNCLRYCKTAVTLRCYKDEDSVVFEISDDGPGIAPEVADHLFERFSKGSDGKHGIGLALALAIAEEHGGTVKAHNKEKGGACFEIIIPCVKRRDQLSKMNNDSAT